MITFFDAGESHVISLFSPDHRINYCLHFKLFLIMMEFACGWLECEKWQKLGLSVWISLISIFYSFAHFFPLVWVTFRLIGCIKPSITRSHRGWSTNCYYCIQLIIQSVYYFIFFSKRVQNAISLRVFFSIVYMMRVLYPSICYSPTFFGNF